MTPVLPRLHDAAVAVQVRIARKERNFQPGFLLDVWGIGLFQILL